MNVIFFRTLGEGNRQVGRLPSDIDILVYKYQHLTGISHPRSSASQAAGALVCTSLWQPTPEWQPRWQLIRVRHKSADVIGKPGAPPLRAGVRCNGDVQKRSHRDLVVLHNPYSERPSLRLDTPSNMQEKCV